MDYKEELSVLRKQIDTADTKLVECFCERMRISDRIGEIKARNNMVLTDHSRESQVIDAATALAGDGYEETAAFMRSLIELSKRRQLKKMGYDIMEICIVGLGLIGGSLAFALKDFKGARITGVDIDPDVCDNSIKRGAVAFASTNLRGAVKNADMVVFCVNPDIITGIIKDLEFKTDAVITEVCGIKNGLVDNIRKLLPNGIDYIPCHPMAGKEVGGFDNAEAELFLGKGFLITPFADSKPENISLIEEMAKFIGASEILCCRADEHDRIIAYTSHLCHISALALCLDPPPEVSAAFLGGSFRDCTRVANINADLWSSLFIYNKANLLSEIKRLQDGIEAFYTAVESGDQSGLRGLIERAAGNKKALSAKRNRA